MSKMAEGGKHVDVAEQFAKYDVLLTLKRLWLTES